MSCSVKTESLSLSELTHWTHSAVVRWWLVLLHGMSDAETQDETMTGSLPPKLLDLKLTCISSLFLRMNKPLCWVSWWLSIQIHAKCDVILHYCLTHYFQKAFMWLKTVPSFSGNHHKHMRKKVRRYPAKSHREWLHGIARRIPLHGICWKESWQTRETSLRGYNTEWEIPVECCPLFQVCLRISLVFWHLSGVWCIYGRFTHKYGV